MHAPARGTNNAIPTTTADDRSAESRPENARDIKRHSQRDAQARSSLAERDTLRHLWSLQCGKTNVLISLLKSPHGVRFENVYVYSKSLQQSKYRYLERLLGSMEDIGYYTFSNNRDVVPPSEALPDSIFIFDDVACDK